MNAPTIPLHDPFVPNPVPNPDSGPNSAPSPTWPMSPSSHLPVNANDRIPDVRCMVTRNPYLVEFE